MEEFRAIVKRYLDVDNLCKAANKTTRDLRETCRGVEVEMVEMITRNPELSKLNKVELPDKSYIKIDKPGWNKPWSLSKKDFREHLDSFFQMNEGYANADTIYDHVVREQGKKLVSTEFAINRLVRE